MDLRKHPRMTTQPTCKARFKWGGHLFNGVAVSNLGLQGCCLQIPAVGAYGLRKRMILEALTLSQPSLPNGSVEARVVWLQPRRGRQMDGLDAGVEFLDGAGNLG